MKTSKMSIIVTRSLMSFVQFAKAKFAYKYTGDSLSVQSDNYNMRLEMDGDRMDEPLYLSDSLMRYIISFGEGAVVSLKSDDGKTIKAGCGRSHTKMALLTSSAFFSENDEEGETSAYISPDGITTLKTVSSAAMNEALGVRAAVSTVFIKTNSHGDTVAFSTDGHKLAVGKIENATAINASISKTMLAKLLSYKPFKNGFRVAESKNKRKLIFSSDDTSIAVPQVECNAIDYEAILRLQDASEVSFCKSGFETALKRAQELMGVTKTPYGKLTISADAISFVSRDETYESEDIFNIVSKTPHKEVVIGININDLNTALSALEADEEGNATLIYQKGLSPFVLKDTKITFLLMPVRINGLNS